MSGAAGRAAGDLASPQAAPQPAGAVDWDEVFSSDTEDEADGAQRLQARVDRALALKQDGNALLQGGQVPEARAAYQQALALVWAPYRRPGSAQAAGAQARRELDAVIQRRAAPGGQVGGPAVVAKGFLAGAPAADGDAARPPLDSAEPWWHSESDVGAGDEGREWASGEQVQATIEVNGYLAAISACRVRCASAAERDALSEQLALSRKLLLEAQAAVDTATVSAGEPAPALPAPLDLEELLGRMARGLEAFRPFWAQQERRPGEFDALRVCRRLAPRSFDVELVRMGDAAPATPEDFAGALFPPLGQPKDAAAAAWQRELFHRVFQKDASKYVAGAAWAVLRELLSRGAALQYRGRRVCDAGLAHGFYFASPAPEGPDAPEGGDGGEFDSVDASARADALVICAAADKRVVLQRSFMSLGVVHKWLLLAVEAQDAGAARPGPPEEVAADLCCGALGLLPEASPDCQGAGFGKLADAVGGCAA
ncbi:unnamed protein product [Prorocentrum cordatum]|uniref:Uncharacterized protein n=1 Tax=Prorocentrum cordatum TaxID=2364126 RepID=A0ABN9PW15_9DINO|nr:unnamed protein product [Polarella glacialis]